MATDDSEVDMRGAVGDLRANAPGGIACALQINIQPCLNGTNNNLIHRVFDRAFGIGVQESPHSAGVEIGLLALGDGGCTPADRPNDSKADLPPDSAARSFLD